MTSSTSSHPKPKIQAPLYRRFVDLFDAGFSIDWGIGSFLVISHLAALLLTPVSIGEINGLLRVDFLFYS